MNHLNNERRRMLKRATALVAGAALPGYSWSSTFPKGPLRMVLPVAAGGAADASSRPLAVELEKSLKQPVIVDNRPGGLFVIGMQSVLQSPADGHTLIYVYNSVASVQAVHKRFDLNRQLIPVTQTTTMPMVLLVPGNSRFKNAADMFRFAKANPGGLSYASPGVGSTEHLKAVQIGRAGGFVAKNIPYKSGPEMIKGVIGGEVDFVLTAASFAFTFAPKGQLRVLAVVDAKRIAEMLDVPTIAEAGVNVPPLQFWGGYAVRAGTPEPIVERLFDEIRKAAMEPSVRDRLLQLGITATTSKSVQAFRTLVAEEVAWMSDTARDLNITPES